MPVPGPTMMMGTAGSAGRRKWLVWIWARICPCTAARCARKEEAMPWRSLPRRIVCTTLTQRCTWPGVATGLDAIEYSRGLRLGRDLARSAKRGRAEGNATSKSSKSASAGSAPSSPVAQAAQGSGLRLVGGGHGQQVHRPIERPGDIHLPGEGVTDRAHRAIADRAPVHPRPRPPSANTPPPDRGHSGHRWQGSRQVRTSGRMATNRS